MLFQPPLPPKYAAMSQADLAESILRRKREFGSRLVILGHHYQQDEVIQFADFTGDSLKLSQIGGQQGGAEFIVFCGVHFMAESADILTDDSVTVVLPDLSAGCSMADMADIDDLEEAWEYLVDECSQSVVPITYVNSAASIKAFCGEHGGACCTSSNAAQVLKWAYQQGDRVIFLPDQHLGRNTAFAMGIPLDKMVVYDPHERHGGLTTQQVRDAKVFLWKGHCSVHALFTPQQCHEIRAIDPAYNIIVHPECSWEVLQEADIAGSTEFIIKTVREAPARSKWAIGTEVHLVNRLMADYPDKSIRLLAGIQCLCTTMYRVDLKHLCWCLDELADGREANPIRVAPATKKLAFIALERMLENVSPVPVAVK
jgi:quinolinate synthase